MNDIECRVCGNSSKYIFEEMILTKYNIKYYVCSSCEFLQTEKPYWLEEAYENSISILDTGIFYRNNDLLKKVLFTITESSDKLFDLYLKLFPDKIHWIPYTKKLLDYGGGNGILVRLLRDVGIDAYWIDKYSKNVFARGFEYKEDKEYPIITCFELFEHFENPYQEFKEIVNRFDPEMLIFSTNLYGSTVPSKDWWYYVFETGQHIGFYSENTLNFLAKKFQLKYYSPETNFHIFSKNDFNYSKIIKMFKKNNTEIYESIKKYYNSLTFSDHLFLKKLLS